MPVVSGPREIAPEVRWLPLGGALRAVNVYFIAYPARGASSTPPGGRGTPGDPRGGRGAVRRRGEPGRRAADARPPDHAGDRPRARAGVGMPGADAFRDEVPARQWDAEAIRAYAGPLDRWVILRRCASPASERMKAVLAKGSMADVAGPLAPGAPLPGLPGWTTLPAPGHTPGHVAFLRRDDRVLVTGDALVTLDLNSLRGVAGRRPRIAGPPWYTTWSWTAAKASASALARLEPLVIAPGHGRPMRGLGAADSPECGRG